MQYEFILFDWQRGNCHVTGEIFSALRALLRRNPYNHHKTHILQSDFQIPGSVGSHGHPGGSFRYETASSHTASAAGAILFSLRLFRYTKSNSHFSCKFQKVWPDHRPPFPCLQVLGRQSKFPFHPGLQFYKYRLYQGYLDDGFLFPLFSFSLYTIRSPPPVHTVFQRGWRPGRPSPSPSDCGAGHPPPPAWRPAPGPGAPGW